MKHPVATLHLRELLGAAWPRTLCRFDVRSRGLDPAAVRSARVDGASVPFQATPDGRIGLFLDLPAWGKRNIEFRASGGRTAPKAASRLDDAGSAGVWLRFATGDALLPPLGERRFDPPADSLAAPPPIRRLRTRDGREIGRGWIDTYERVASVSCEVAETGPLWTTLRVRYVFDTGATFLFEATAAECEDFLRIREEAWLGPKARWVFALGEDDGLLPDAIDLADHTLFHETRQPSYRADRLHARLYPWTQGTQIAALREGFVAHSAATGDAIGWFARTDPEWDGFKGAFLELRERRIDPARPRSRGGETDGDTFSWLPPDHPRPADTHDAAALCAEAFLTGGSRCYGLMLGDRATWHRPDPVPPHTLEWYEGPALLAEWSAARSPLRARLQHQGLLSLDIVKDWRLDLPASTSCASASAPGASAASRATSVTQNPAGAHSAFLATADYPEALRPLLGDLRANAAAICRRMRDELAVLAGGYVAARGPGGTNPVTLRRAFPYAALLRDLLRLAAIPRRLPDDPARLPPLAERLAASVLFLAHLCARRSFYPGEFTMLPMADPRSSEPSCLGMPNMNFLTDVYVCAGGIAALFPAHPTAQAWLERANRLLGMQLDVYSDPRSGSWEESHTYFNHVLRTLGPFALVQRGAPLPAAADWFADPRFARLARAALAFVTPRDPNAGGLRMMAPLGDHRMELRWHTGAILAQGFAAHRSTRRLARELAWLAKENGSAIDLPVAPLRPDLGPHRVEGLGAVLRDGESMLLLRAGYQWGHHNDDELEVLYWFRGEPVLCEAGYGAPKTFAKVGASGHSILHPRDFDAAFYLSRVTRGHVTVFEPGPSDRPQTLAAERLVAFRQPPAGILAPLPLAAPYRQSRRLEWIADDGSGSALLRVIDCWEGPHPQCLQFHTGGVAVEALGPGRCRIRGHRHDTLVESSATLDWQITPDACGFTTGFALSLPAGLHEHATTFRIL